MRRSLHYNGASCSWRIQRRRLFSRTPLLQATEFRTEEGRISGERRFASFGLLLTDRPGFLQVPSLDIPPFAPLNGSLPFNRIRKNWFSSGHDDNDKGNNSLVDDSASNGNSVDKEEGFTKGATSEPTSSAASPTLSESDLQLAISAAQEAAQEAAQTTTSSTDSVGDALSSSSIDGFTDVPGAQKGGKKLAIIFTCTVCNTRSAKQFTEKAYREGVVLVRCPNCQNLHLIADRLGFFDDSKDWDIETVIREKAAQQQEGSNGNEHMPAFKTVMTEQDVLELTVADVLGEEKMQEVINQASEGTSTPTRDDNATSTTAPPAESKDSIRTRK